MQMREMIRLVESPQPERHCTSAEFQQALHDAVAQFMGYSWCTTARDINEGDCGSFAMMVMERLGLPAYGRNSDPCMNSTKWFWDEQDGLDLAKARGLGEPVPDDLLAAEDFPAGYVADQLGSVHYWLTYQRRHYDAECLGGVDHFLDLPYFQRIIARLRAELGARISDRSGISEARGIAANSAPGSMAPPLFHGTCAENAASLLRQGWAPHSGSRGGNMGQARYLYLSTGVEDALWFAEQKGCDTVVELRDVPLDHLIVDPEDGSYDTLHDELHSPHGFPGKVALTKSLPARHFRLHPTAP